MGEATPDGKNPGVLEDALLIQFIIRPSVIQQCVPDAKKRSGQKGAWNFFFSLNFY